MNLELVLVSVYSAINLTAFLIMAYDKHVSKQGGDTGRIPEGVIFFMATAFGSVGVLFSMLILRHKTRKWYFKIGIPLLIMQNLAFIYFGVSFSL